MLGFDISAALKLNGDSLYIKMKNEFETMDDKESYNLIKENYQMILSDIVEKKERKEVSGFILYVTNSKFISTLTQVMYSENVDIAIKRKINKMAYDYLSLPDEKKDPYTNDLLMALAKTVNRDIIPKLCTVPLCEDHAALLAEARFSSEKETINVKRLNKEMMQLPPNTLTEQKIVNIYLALFDHILPLFTGVMLDVQSPQNMSDNMEEVYGLITLAILDIMNELPIQDIKTGLKLFDSDRNILYPDSCLRMNLKACSPQDFPRFIQALDELEAEGEYIATR